jgi:TolB-like protein/class 3 adenylate cyclase/tRNA A-37 threonylcarbamoyl transferase component Bud32/Flp pilus assembly protein TadD
MTAERWQTVKAIFEAALEHEPGARTQFVKDRCGADEDLRREVDSLLLWEAKETAAPALLFPSAAEEVPVITERYEVKRELGRGGMSVVYLARDRQLLDKPVVVKVLLEETGQDAWIRQKFLQEMEALSRIDHPGVVGVLDTGVTAEGKRFLVMQYIEGGTLRSIIELAGIGFARTASIIRQVGQALGAAHEKGVWHRDLKPENIMVQRRNGEDHVRLIDFGIAGIQNSQFTGEKTKIAGSVQYMAPEQLMGQGCAASDTYALALVACELLIGSLPRETGGGSRALPEEIPDAARRPILKALAFRPEWRYADVREFSEELCRALTSGIEKATARGTVEIAHVLFTDLVGYSLLPMDRQKDYLKELQEVVRESEHFRAAEATGDLISLPTGDGMALAFFGDPTAPASCALEVAAGLKKRPHLKLRMGINSGPVYRVADLNANANLAGGGVNMAQRVMDCGDAGHILLSKNVADVLSQLSEWSPWLRDLGRRTVKHGVVVHLYALATAEVGNREPPHRIAGKGADARSRWRWSIAAAVALAIGAGALWFGRNGLAMRPAPDKASVAVLPFADMSPEKNREYFSDGMAEEVLNALARTPGLRVAGRTSSFRFRGRSGDYAEIGRKLNVATILEGSVGMQGNRTRIRVQLIKAADGFQLWSDSFERDATDLFAAEEQIAGAVRSSLEVALLRSGPAPASRTSNPEAYNAYLQGLYFLQQHTPASHDKADSYFEKAVQLDPGFAKGWAGLAEAFSGKAGDGADPEGNYGKAREAAARALKLDPTLAEAHAAMAWVQQFEDWDWAGADASYKKALQLEPGNAIVVSHAGILARILGHVDEASSLGRQAMQMDPLSPGTTYNAGTSFYYAGRFDEAIGAFRKALELRPEMARPHSWIGRVYLAQGKAKEAQAEAELESYPELRLFGLALAFGAMGRREESDAKMAEIHSQYYMEAELYASRGEVDRAFAALDRAFAEHDTGLAQLKGDPLLKSLMGDKRYSALLKKMRLPDGFTPPQTWL